MNIELRIVIKLQIVATLVQVHMQYAKMENKVLYQEVNAKLFQKNI